MRKYIPIIILLVLSAFNVRMAEGLARKALVAPDCMINNLINVAKVASGVTNMDYLLQPVSVSKQEEIVVSYL